MFMLGSKQGACAQGAKECGTRPHIRVEVKGLNGQDFFAHDVDATLSVAEFVAQHFSPFIHQQVGTSYGVLLNHILGDIHREHLQRRSAFDERLATRIVLQDQDDTDTNTIRRTAEQDEAETKVATDGITAVEQVAGTKQHQQGRNSNANFKVYNDVVNDLQTKACQKLFAEPNYSDQKGLDTLELASQFFFTSFVAPVEVHFGRLANDDAALRLDPETAFQDHMAVVGRYTIPQWHTSAKGFPFLAFVSSELEVPVPKTRDAFWTRYKRRDGRFVVTQLHQQGVDGTSFEAVFTKDKNGETQRWVRPTDAIGRGIFRVAFSSEEDEALAMRMIHHLRDIEGSGATNILRTLLRRTHSDRIAKKIAQLATCPSQLKAFEKWEQLAMFCDSSYLFFTSAENEQIGVVQPSMKLDELLRLVQQEQPGAVEPQDCSVKNVRRGGHGHATQSPSPSRNASESWMSRSPSCGSEFTAFTDEMESDVDVDQIQKRTASTCVLTSTSPSAARQGVGVLEDARGTSTPTSGTTNSCKNAARVQEVEVLTLHAIIHSDAFKDTEPSATEDGFH
ncbi:unnamed protein product [Amoebophrya sp. A120]|nr:unnamed protein product [Amoebophrya sp. A120]|eukprot:GSA120T00018007001.1